MLNNAKYSDILEMISIAITAADPAAV